MLSRERRIVSAEARPKSGERGRARTALINGFGALGIAMVLLVILYSRFWTGAPPPAFPSLTSPLGICAGLAVLGLVLLAAWCFCRSVADCADEVDAAAGMRDGKHIVIVPVCGVHPGTMAALDYARCLGEDVRAVFVETDAQSAETIVASWAQESAGTPLMVLDSPRNSVTEPLLAYIDALERGPNNARVTVVLPELVTTRGLARLLPGPMELALKGALLCREGVAITSIRSLRHPFANARPESRDAAGQLAVR